MCVFLCVCVRACVRACVCVYTIMAAHAWTVNLLAMDQQLFLALTSLANCILHQNNQVSWVQKLDPTHHGTHAVGGEKTY